MARRFAVLAAVLPLVAASLLLIGPTSAGATGSSASAGERTSQRAPVVGARCKKAGKTVFKLRGIRHEIRVGYARTFVLSPSETWRKVRHVRKDMTISGRVKASGGGELGAKGISKLLIKAEVELHTSLEAFAKRYTSSETTVKRRVHNPTKRNKQFVAYKATHDYRGKYKQFFCTKHPVMTHPEWTLRSQGRWRSHEPLEVGTLRCGAGTPGAIATFVARRHCG